MDDRPFVYAGSCGPIGLPKPVTDGLTRLGETIVHRSQLSGLFGVDVIVDRTGKITLLEVNPRWTASSELIERDLLHRNCSIPGLTLLGAMLDGVGSGQIKSAIESAPGDVGKMFWKRIVYAHREGRMDHASLPIHCGKLLQPFAHGKSRIQLADLPNDGQYLSRHEPILTLILTILRPSIGKTTFPWREARELNRSVQRAIHV